MKEDVRHTIDVDFVDLREEIYEYSGFLGDKLNRLQRIKINQIKKSHSYKALRRLLRSATAHGSKNTKKYEVLLQRYKGA